VAKFLLDANLSRKVASGLARQIGIDVQSALGIGIGQHPDHLIVQYAKRQGRVLISLDKDYESKDTGLFEQSSGVIYLKLPDGYRKIPLEIEIISDFLRDHANTIVLERSLVVVTPWKVEVVRTLPD
jgi:predicted nuclease of predicted toxin-antitoxin system